MWVWTPRLPDAAALARFAEAAGVREMYLSVPWEIDSVLARRLRDVVRLSEARGIAVAALGGAPQWADHPADAASWARGAVAAAAFSRVHLDIEPWAHPQWHRASDRLKAGYLAALDSVRGAIGGLPLDVDVAHFLGEVAGPQGSLLDAVLARADRIVVMAYRNAARDVVELATPTIVAATRAGKKCAVGIAAGVGPEYFGTVTELLAAVAEIERRFAENNSFAGVVVHDQQSWQRLPQR